MKKKDVQFCGKCGSKNIINSLSGNDYASISNFGILRWDCLDCGNTGNDFFIVSEEEYKKILFENFTKKK